MSRLAGAVRELLGLFVDDWRYALAILVCIGAVAALDVLGLSPAIRGPALAAGLIVIFVGSFLRLPQNR